MRPQNTQMAEPICIYAYIYSLPVNDACTCKISHSSSSLSSSLALAIMIISRDMRRVRTLSAIVLRIRSNGLFVACPRASLAMSNLHDIRTRHKRVLHARELMAYTQPHTTKIGMMRIMNTVCKPSTYIHIPYLYRYITDTIKRYTHFCNFSVSGSAENCNTKKIYIQRYTVNLQARIKNEMESIRHVLCFQAPTNICV